MKAPFFWYRSPGIFSTLLQPLSWLYDLGGRIHTRTQKPKQFPIPIISIGNLVSGGSGKTPVTIAISKLLQKQNIDVHVVTRGYGGTAKGPLQVDPSHHSAKEVGDEALLLANVTSTWVAKDRPEGVKKALEAGAQVVLLDDGHQTTSLHKDISLLVVDAAQRFGNGHVIPAGPLRENLARGLSRADAVIFIGEESLILPKPLFKGRLISDPLPLGLKRVAAFCGLGFPQKFYNSLTNLGLEVVGTQSFADHYFYTNQDLNHLETWAKDLKASLITTQKDSVKIPLPWRQTIPTLNINIEFEVPEEIYTFMVGKLRQNYDLSFPPVLPEEKEVGY